MGAEAVAIFAIFTGQAWNIMLTLYQIMEVIPSDLVNVTDQFKYNAWEKFWRLEFVYSIMAYFGTLLFLKLRLGLPWWPASKLLLPFLKKPTFIYKNWFLYPSSIKSSRL